MAYSDIPQVGQLTALLLAKGVRDIVVCPGSRNAPLIHNFHATGERIRLHPLTDERSAAFAALGISLATQEPAAVCVTSGSALLNCLPAVAEAHYRHIPLLVISADRPQQWTGQGDGQTLPQAGAMLPYCPTAQLRTPRTEEERWYNNRLINGALATLCDNGGGPAHINVPIEEPLFSFAAPDLPAERVAVKIQPKAENPLPAEVLRLIASARLPALVIGQYERGDLRQTVETLDAEGQMLVIGEILSDVRGSFRSNSFDTLSAERDADALPDVVVHIGGNFVHKRFKSLLRKNASRVVRIGRDGHMTDTFCRLAYWIDCAPLAALEQLVRELPRERESVRRAAALLDATWSRQRESLDREAQAAGTLTFHATLLALREALSEESEAYALHLGNSTAVRAASKVFEAGTVPVFCNRGTNGIEGSLSTAAGYARAMWGKTVAVLGDLSFFYDANALWSDSLPRGLRILLLNNGRGAIFDTLAGLEQSPAKARYISAGGTRLSAEGLCRTFGVGYHRAESKTDLAEKMRVWLATDGAQLLEVCLP